MLYFLVYLLIGLFFAETWFAFARRSNEYVVLRYAIVMFLWPLMILVIIKAKIGGPLGK